MEKVDPIQFFLLFLYYYCLVYPNHKKKNIFFSKPTLFISYT